MTITNKRPTSSSFTHVASAQAQQVTEPCAVRHMVDRATRIAKAERPAACVIVPADIQDMAAVPEQPVKTHTVHSGVGCWPPRQIPSASKVCSPRFPHLPDNAILSADSGSAANWYARQIQSALA